MPPQKCGCPSLKLIGRTQFTRSTHLKAVELDIYRFFHPHHNPRLHSTPLRQQELSELEQAASELRKALERAQSRTARRQAGLILPGHFDDILKAMRFVEYSMQTLCDAHPGDEKQTILDLINERSDLSGWEAWTNLLREQVSYSAEGNAAPLDSLARTVRKTGAM